MITPGGFDFIDKGNVSKTLAFRLIVLGRALNDKHGNTKKDEIQSFADSPSECGLYVEVRHANVGKDPP